MSASEQLCHRPTSEMRGDPPAGRNIAAQRALASRNEE